MKGKSPDPNQLSFYNQRLADQLNPKHPLYRLAEQIPGIILIYHADTIGLVLDDIKLSMNMKVNCRGYSRQRKN